MRYFHLILALSAILVSGCKSVSKPTDDACSDGGSAAPGKVVCDGLPPIEDGLGELDDAGADVEHDN